MLASFKDTLRVLAKSRVVWTGSSLILAYWLVAALVPTMILNQYMNFILASVAVSVVVTYIPHIKEAIERDKLDQVSQLTLGIALGFFAVMINRVWENSTAVFESPWMRSSPMIGFYVYLGILAGVLHMTAPGVIDGRVPQRNWVWIGLAAGAGFLVTSIAIYTNYGRILFF